MTQFYISRQKYDDQPAEKASCVEIAVGGKACASNTALPPKYEGENFEFDNPDVTIVFALYIFRKWQSETTDIINLSYGEVTDNFFTTSVAQLSKWAEDAIDGVPRCFSCNKLLQPEPITNDFHGESFCCEWCADEADAKYGDRWEQLD